MEIGEPSPKSQTQLVITPVVGTDKSLKMVDVPKQLDIALKFATGSVFTKTGRVIKLTQPFDEVQINVTLNVPDVVYK